MKILLAAVATSARRLRNDPAFTLVEDYLKRASAYIPSEFAAYDDEAALLRAVDRLTGRSAAALLAFDSRGQTWTSEQFAERLATLRDAGRQHLLFAIGPASGWSPAALARADVTLSLGRMTLPHALAQAVVAEQIYRALTILAGHPYHSGH